MANCKDFSFLLFSDLHNHKYMNFDLTQARSRLIDFLGKKDFPCDYIFIAGDIANQCDYTGARDYIARLHGAVGKLPEDGKQRVFWAVGNHDIKRGRKLRERIIHGIRNSTSLNPHEDFEQAMNDDDTREIITQKGMSEYLEAYRDVCGFEFPQNEIQDAHRFFDLEELNLFVLNTCLTSCDNDDSYKLLFLESRLESLFGKARPGIPTIVLGHHGREFLHPEEQGRLHGLFENRIDMYLCGHTHRAGYSSFEMYPHKIHQITCGGGMIDGYSKLVFMHGVHDRQAKHLTITPYSYAENGSQNWGEDFRLHTMLSEDHHTYRFTRLGTDVEDITSKPKGMVENTLFDQSNKYYNEQTNLGGRFAYVKHDDTLPELKSKQKKVVCRERHDKAKTKAERILARKMYPQL